MQARLHLLTCCLLPPSFCVSSDLHAIPKYSSFTWRWPLLYCTVCDARPPHLPAALAASAAFFSSFSFRALASLRGERGAESVSASAAADPPAPRPPVHLSLRCRGVMPSSLDPAFLALRAAARARSVSRWLPRVCTSTRGAPSELPGLPEAFKALGSLRSQAGAAGGRRAASHASPF